MRPYLNHNHKRNRLGDDETRMCLAVAIYPDCAYLGLMYRFFDMTDHARLPQRFTRENRSVLARLR